ncbi:MAG: TIGR01459 family HAD-type hydrolase [Hyphomicrobium sp.]|jgi:HAD superfamily hydrolase (TIGR01459 family)
MQEKSPTTPPPLPILSSIAGLASGREAWLTDIWGVMHNGVTPFLAAADACARFRAAGGLVLLLSNAPRPAPSVIAQLDRIGVPRQAWDAILTSGDAARALVSAFGPRSVFHLGPDRDLALYEDLDVRLADAATAEAISCTGLFEDEVESPDDYADLLADFATRRLPMVCANPDLTVERGSKIIPCAGALATAYEKLGGSVTYAGKPYLPVYDQAIAKLAELKGRHIERASILAIGDGIRTDISGAAAAGIDSVFIASGVHVAGGLESDGLARLFPNPAVRPIAAMSGLVW